MIIDPNNRAAMMFYAWALPVAGVVFLWISGADFNSIEFWSGSFLLLIGCVIGVYVRRLPKDR